MKDQQQPEEMKRELGLLDATMLVAGSMIGSGIFIVSADIVRQVGSAWWLLLVWLLTGTVTLFAAVSYGELSAMFPKAGGQYIYLRESYNRFVGFLYGWSFFTVIQTGTIAAVGIAFAKFAAYLFPAVSDQHILFSIGSFHFNAAQLLAIVVIVLLTWVNSRGIRNGKIIQTTLTTIKLLSLFGLIIAGFVSFRADVWQANWSSVAPGRWLEGAASPVPISGAMLFAGITAAMVGSLFSSDAWNNVTFIAGEIRNPTRNIGRSLLYGTLIVTVIYVLCNVMYIGTLPMNEIAHAPADRVAVSASQYIFGSGGALVIAIMIMISTFGCNNGLILSGARLYYSMAKDGLFFKSVSTLNKAEVPAKGLWVQCVWASFLCLTGKYGDLLDYVVFVVLIFYILTIIGIFILRRKRPDIPRSYRAIGYPVIPALYCLAAISICIGLIIYKTATCGWGLVIVLLGIPAYFIFQRLERN
ncbi:MAG: amino acid permease [Flavihumibacter sp.]